MSKETTKTLAEKMHPGRKPFKGLPNKTPVSRETEDAFCAYLKDLSKDELMAKHGKVSGVFRTMVKNELADRSPYCDK